MTCSVCGKPIVPGKQKYFRKPSGKRIHESCTAFARPPGSTLRRRTDMHYAECPQQNLDTWNGPCRCDEIRQREAERKPDTATGTVQTAEKPLPDFSDIFEREEAYRKKHGLSEDAIIFPDELYTREEMVVRAQAEIWKACHGSNVKLTGSDQR